MTIVHCGFCGQDVSRHAHLCRQRLAPNPAPAMARILALVEREFPGPIEWQSVGIYGARRLDYNHTVRAAFKAALTDLERKHAAALEQARADERERIAKAFDALANSLPAGVLRDGFGKDAARFVRGLE